MLFFITKVRNLK